MVQRESSSPINYGELTKGLIDLQEIVYHLRSVGLLQEASDIGVLNLRLKKLATEPTTADKLDFEKYLAWDVIQTMRKTLKCPIERSIAHHCEVVMAELERTTRALASKEKQDAGKQ